MRNDDSGVAGFFEDLPALFLVLGGTMLLVSSGVWTSTRMADDRQSDMLHALAEQAMEGVVERIESLAIAQGLPSLHAIGSANLTTTLDELLESHHYILNASDLCRPESWSLTLRDGYSGEIRETGFARRLLNALDGSGLFVIVEVRLIVWKD